MHPQPARKHRGEEVSSGQFNIFQLFIKVFWKYVLVLYWLDKKHRKRASDILLSQKVVGYANS